MEEGWKMEEEGWKMEEEEGNYILYFDQNWTASNLTVPLHSTQSTIMRHHVALWMSNVHITT
jgi:hypothetical protein